MINEAGRMDRSSQKGQLGDAMENDGRNRGQEQEAGERREEQREE